MQLLSAQPLTLEQLSKKLGIKSGGGLKSYLVNLESAQFIQSYRSSPDSIKVKKIHYRVIDPFLKFYLNFVGPNRRLIENIQSPVDAMRTITKNKLAPFLGLAFENFCNLYALDIAEKLGVRDEVKSWGPFNHSGDGGFQIDLLFFKEYRSLVVCEIKYSDKKIEAQIISEMERKCEKLLRIYPDHSLIKVLITTMGVSSSLEASQYFDHILTAKQILHK